VLIHVTAWLTHIAGTKWGTRQYLKMEGIDGQIREFAAADWKDRIEVRYPIRFRLYPFATEDEN